LEKTVAFTTHDPNDTLKLAGHLVILKEDKVVR
jgi:ABC-type proline/glycine betaine transport system ATPase subunit